MLGHKFSNTLMQYIVNKVLKVSRYNVVFTSLLSSSADYVSLHPSYQILPWSQSLLSDLKCSPLSVFSKPAASCPPPKPVLVVKLLITTGHWHWLSSSSSWVCVFVSWFILQMYFLLWCNIYPISYWRVLMSLPTGWWVTGCESISST